VWVYWHGYVCACVRGFVAGAKFPFIFLHNFFPRFLEPPPPSLRVWVNVGASPVVSVVFVVVAGRWQRCRRRSIWIAPAETPTATPPPAAYATKNFFLCVRWIFFRFFCHVLFLLYSFFFFLLSLSCWRCCCCGRCFFSKLPLGCVCVCVGRRRPLVRQAHTHTAH